MPCFPCRGVEAAAARGHALRSLEGHKRAKQLQMAQKKGFAAMAPEKQREIASKGGKSLSIEIRREIGRKGGMARAEKLRKNFILRQQVSTQELVGERALSETTSNELPGHQSNEPVVPATPLPIAKELSVNQQTTSAS
jgi:general stress protein YciG